MGRYEQTIGRWIESDKLPSIKRHSQRSILAADVDRIRASMPELASPLPDRVAALDGSEHSLVDQTENMQGQIRNLREQLTALNQRLDERPSLSHIGWPRLSGADKRGMPAGTMHLVKFARSQGLAVPEIKLLYWSNKIELAVHKRTGGVMHNKQEWWITFEHHRALIAYALHHDVPCRCCEWCVSEQTAGLCA